MLARLGSFVVRRRRRVLIASALLFVVAGVVGGNVAEHLSSGGFEDDGAESHDADQLLEQHFGTGDPNFILLVEPEDGDVDSAATARAGTDLTRRLGAEEGVAEVASYWLLPGTPEGFRAPPFRTEDGDAALVIARIDGDEDYVDEVARDLTEEYRGTASGLKVGVGGFAAIFNEVGDQIEKDMARAETLALPVTLLLLVLIFGGVVAASLPLAIGVVAIIGTFLVLRVLSELTQVSIFALNMTTAMGLGLAIDYSLFVVSRYREELGRGLSVHDAVVKTVQTAGRTVIYSALTVAVSLAALLVFPLAFLRSFGYAGIAVVLIAGLAAVVLLPAILAALGHRVDKWAIRKRRPQDVGEGFWHRLAMMVMKRPIPVATVVIGLLLLVGSPFLHITLGLPDDRVLPASASTRSVHDEIRERFDTQEAGALKVVATGIGDAGRRTGDIDAYAKDLSRIEGVGRVEAVTGLYLDGRKLPVQVDALSARYGDEDSTWFSVVPTVEPMSGDGEAVVEAVRDTEAPFDVKVGGMSARLVDAKDSLFAKMPLALAIIALTTFVVLFLMVGSLLVPLKALVLNILSLTATFGAMVWVFQDGNLSGLLDFTEVGYIEVTTPILMFCIAFGLSMDYEVFLLSRIKEEYDRSADNELSVAAGLERTGRIVTAAAALIAIVFIANVSSQVAFIKLFGLGMALAVVADATLVRATLVPAFMRLAGRANWWAPPFLRKVYERYGLSESEGEGEADEREAA